MKIEDLQRTLDIHQSVVDLAERIEAETGKPVEVRLDKEMKAPAMVKIARSRMSYHLIKLHPNYASVASYLVANKCANILRLMGAEPADRFIPATTSLIERTVRASMEQSGGSKILEFSDERMHFWITGLINQLTNLPVQIRIEQWVYHTLPELRTEQKTYLEKDVQQCVAVLTQEIERITPRIIFDTGNAMTYAFVRSVGELLGSNFTQRYYDYRETMRRGKDLYGMVDPDDGSYASDMRIINEWSKYLGIDGWFLWRDFEEMPESYYADVRI